MFTAAREKVVDDPHREVLSEFLDHNRDALHDAPAVLGPVIRGLVNSLAGDLVDAGFADEAISQAFVLLLAPTARRFDPARGTAAQYLYGLVLRAAAEVRVQYGAAGIAKNDRRLRLVRDQADDDRWVRSHQREPWREDLTDLICLRVDVERALKAAPHILQAAAAELAERDLSMSETAAAVRIDRNTLRRRLRAWATTAGLSA